jgi:co-chaperonin GroES (HSP10)
MIQAVADKVIVNCMTINKTKSGLILPDGVVTEPQSYGVVVSVGEDVKGIKEGDYLVFFTQAGMTMTVKGVLMKTLKFEEIYGVLQDDEIKESLEVMKIGEPSKIIS